MQRRHLFGAALAAAGALVSGSGRTARAASDDRKRLRVAYHLCDLDKVSFVLGNIQNHFDGAGGPDQVSITLVVHGPALKAFHNATASADTARRMQTFARAGLKPYACGNTMQAQKVALGDLVPGFTIADRGGVVLLPSCRPTALPT